MVGDNGVLSNNPNTWIPYSSTITKTIYDPCPYGYRVPINGSWTGWTETPKWTQYAITGGASWPATNGAWWPATGYRNNGSAAIVSFGYRGNYWSSSRYSNVYQAPYLWFHYGGTVTPSTSTVRSYGLSVRCIEEKKINKVIFERMSLLF